MRVVNESFVGVFDYEGEVPPTLSLFDAQLNLRRMLSKQGEESGMTTISNPNAKVKSIHQNVSQAGWGSPSFDFPSEIATNTTPL